MFSLFKPRKIWNANRRLKNLLLLKWIHRIHKYILMYPYLSRLLRTSLIMKVINNTRYIGTVEIIFSARLHWITYENDLFGIRCWRLKWVALVIKCMRSSNINHTLILNGYVLNKLILETTFIPSLSIYTKQTIYRYYIYQMNSWSRIFFFSSSNCAVRWRSQPDLQSWYIQL